MLKVYCLTRLRDNNAMHLSRTQTIVFPSCSLRPGDGSVGRTELT
jgi:hypothetical protein